MGPQSIHPQSPKPAEGQHGIFDVTSAPPINHQILNRPEVLPVKIFHELPIISLESDIPTDCSSA